MHPKKGTPKYNAWVLTPEYKEYCKECSERVSGEGNPNFGGKYHTEEWRRKQHDSHVGLKRTEETRKKISESQTGEKNANYGKPRSYETRMKISIANSGFNSKNSESHRGEKSHTWKGGISFEPYCLKFNREFKNRVRAFFGYICVECKITQEENGRLLDVHHVNYDKSVCCNDVEPLFVALCHVCNIKANHNRKYWEKHYTNIINEKYGGQCYLPKDVKV